MKEEFRKALIDYFRTTLLQTKGDKTQEEMAELLDMSLRAYQKLEAGETCCSLYTLWRYLLKVCQDHQAFLFGLFHLLDEFDKAMA